MNDSDNIVRKRHVNIIFCKKYKNDVYVSNTTWLQRGFDNVRQKITLIQNSDEVFSYK